MYAITRLVSMQMRKHKNDAAKLQAEREWLWLFTVCTACGLAKVSTCSLCLTASNLTSVRASCMHASCHHCSAVCVMTGVGLGFDPRSNLTYINPKYSLSHTHSLIHAHTHAMQVSRQTQFCTSVSQ